MLGFIHTGLSELIVTSITRADMDLRKTLYSHIVLSGGTTMFQGNFNNKIHGYILIVSNN